MSPEEKPREIHHKDRGDIRGRRFLDTLRPMAALHTFRVLKGADSNVDFDAAVPRAADGKPDLSGVCKRDVI
jgi:hypothetical protein